MISLRRKLVCSLMVLLPLPAVRAEMLNSERIEQKFGSYDIDVVYSEEDLRISNLYSIHGGERITRTLAIVGLPESVDDAIAAEHRAILDGNSIGTVFRNAGWEVVKSGHSYFRTGLPLAVFEAMRITEDTAFAAHYYQLTVTRGELAFDYALVIEIHHPDYLTQADLEAIYGPEEIVGMLGSVRRLHMRGLERFTRFGLSLRQ